MESKLKSILPLLSLLAVPSAAAAEEGHVLDGISASLLFAGGSKHHTTDHAPASGYTENNKPFMLEVEQDKDGLALGAILGTFKDSFDKPSKMALATAELAKSIGDGRVAAGIGAGLIDTSYYDGFGVMPYLEGDYKVWKAKQKDAILKSLAITGKLSHIPKVSDNMDSVTTYGLGLKGRF